MNSVASIRGAIAPAEDITLRCNHSTSHVKWYVSAPQSIEIAPASEFHDFRGLSPPPASLFRKISWFSKIDLMTTDEWERITFLFRNVQSWYFQKMIFKHRRTGRFRQNFELHRFRHRKWRSKFESARTPRPQFVEQSPLLGILLYGVTTLRIMWNHTWVRRKALKSRQRANFMILEASAPRQHHFFGKFHDFRNSTSWRRMRVSV